MEDFHTFEKNQQHHECYSFLELYVLLKVAVF